MVAQTAETVQLPLYGKIAAGTPIEALRDNSNAVDIPASMLGRGEHYALTVEGDSMIEAGIHDGDTVLIERCDNAENGTIVVALIDNNEVTLKRLRRKGDSIALEPANQAHKTRIFGPDRVKLQGKLDRLDAAVLAPLVLSPARTLTGTSSVASIVVGRVFPSFLASAT